MRRVIDEAGIWPPNNSVGRRRRRTARIELLTSAPARALPSPDPIDWPGAGPRRAGARGVRGEDRSVLSKTTPRDRGDCAALTGRVPALADTFLKWGAA